MMISRLKFIATLLLVLVGCTNNDAVAPTGTQITAVTVSVVSGDGQEGEVGSRLPEPIVVRVDWLYEDGTTAPAVGEKVVFEDVDDRIRPTLAEAWTDSAGEVHIWWDLDTSARPYTIEAYWMNYPDCSPVCSEDVTATSGFFSAVAHPGPIHSWTVAPRLAQPAVNGSKIEQLPCFSYPGPPPDCGEPVVTAYIQNGDIVIADVFYRDRYLNLVAPCDTLGAQWQLIDEPAGMSGMVGVDGPRLFVARPTAGIEWVGGWIAVAAVSGEGCKDVSGTPFTLHVVVR